MGFAWQTYPKAYLLSLGIFSLSFLMLTILFMTTAYTSPPHWSLRKHLALVPDSLPTYRILNELSSVFALYVFGFSLLQVVVLLLVKAAVSAFFDCFFPLPESLEESELQVAEAELKEREDSEEDADTALRELRDMLHNGKEQN
jgi:hypothetical protein